MSEPNPTELAPSRPTSCTALFIAFARLALQGFGGVLPIAQRELVERLHWLTPTEFAELLSVGQVLPGPNVINLCLMVGDRYFGWRGAVAALAGMLLLPLLLVLTLAALYRDFSSLPWVVGAVRGMGAVSAGLVLAMALKLLPSLRKNPLGRPLWLPLAVLTGWAVAGWRWPLWSVIASIGGLSCALAWWRLAAPSTPPNNPASDPKP